MRTISAVNSPGNLAIREKISFQFEFILAFMFSKLSTQSCSSYLDRVPFSVALLPFCFSSSVTGFPALFISCCLVDRKPW